MKFNPGDPVWVKITERYQGHLTKSLPLGEIAGVVDGISSRRHISGYTLYDVTIPQGKLWVVYYRLRPRRDDYQQHEPRSTRADLDRILSQPQSAPAEDSRIEASRYLTSPHTWYLK
jgi:hypothetical protein